MSATDAPTPDASTANTSSSTTTESNTNSSLRSSDDSKTREARRERLSSSREMRMKFLTGERPTPKPAQGESLLPVDFEKLPTRESREHSEQSTGSQSSQGGLASALGGAPNLAQLSSVQTQRASSLLLARRFVILLLGLTVAVWPSLRSDSTPATRVWMHMVPLFVMTQLVFRRLHHFFGLPAGWFAGIVVMLKAVAQDFAIMFGVFWLGTMFLRDWVLEQYLGDHFLGGEKDFGEL